MRREPVPGDPLLHPLALGALVLLVLNDHVLKAAFPGLFTGKLSDIAGLVLAPLVLVSMVEVATAAVGRPWGPTWWLTAASAGLVGIGFASIKLFEPAAELYRVGVGLLQWPFAAIAAILRSNAVSGLQPVALVVDPSDLVALPALLIPVLLGWRRARRGRDDP